METPTRYYRVMEDEQEERLDVFLPRRDPSLSRSQAGKLIDGGHVTVNERPVKRSYRIRTGDVVQVDFVLEETFVPSPEPVDLRIVYEDDWIIVVNKPAGLVVHPGAGNRQSTLVHGLLYHCEDISAVGDRFRPGIVHRLDKDTSGLIVVAKRPETHRTLASQFKERQVEKIYLAFVYGDVAGERGTIDFPIGRHPRLRQQMSTHAHRMRDAVTEWEVAERFSPLITFLQLYLHTGRTHQIRVHLDAIGHPVVGDPLYGKGKAIRQRVEAYLKNKVSIPGRQLLHAHILRFIHPGTGQWQEFVAPLPVDMAAFYGELTGLTHV